jgi:hypothetical protein
MDPISERQSRVLWSFWLACGLAATGAIAPFLLTAGGPNRIADRVTIPFGIAAIAMAVNALIYRRGRPLATLLYFLAGIALVYGMLRMVAVPIQLLVAGTCPPLPAACPAGSERPFTGGESNGFEIAILMGTLSILIAFFGLWILFRMRPKLSPPAPVRNEATLAAPIADVAIKAAAEPETAAEALPPTPPETQPASSTPPPDPVAPALPPKPPAKPRVKRAPKPQAELPAPAEPLELPASSSPDEPPSDAPTSS